MIDHLVQEHLGQTLRPQPVPPTIGDRLAQGSNFLVAALDLHQRGLCVVPQLPGTKRPCIKWKRFQDNRPTVEDLEYWFGRRFPTAGLALILGPVSNVFVVDVDGEESYRALIERLGGVPDAPTVFSGSLKPHRFHLYFRYPELTTKATYHPWHPGLEFRGHRGIVIAPPSLHKSGHRYCWAKGKSLDDLPLPPVPEPIHAALAAKAGLRSPGNPGMTALTPLTPAETVRRERRINLLLDLSEKTRDFLWGHYAAGPNWNANLFNAACDMCGCGYSLDQAVPLLLHGAQPWTEQDREAAERTIRSAYSAGRQPARSRAAGRRGSFVIQLSRPFNHSEEEDRS